MWYSILFGAFCAISVFFVPASFFSSKEVYVLSVVIRMMFALAFGVIPAYVLARDMEGRRWVAAAAFFILAAVVCFFSYRLDDVLALAK